MPKSDFGLGVTFLVLNILISVASQFVLKAAMSQMGPLDAAPDTVSYILGLINVKIIGGLFLYGLGTIIWLLCLSKLDLSFAYPAATLQYVLIFIGAYFLFHEQINVTRIIGLIVVCFGVVVMSFDYRRS